MVCSMVIILDGIQDPGNAGAIVRAAEAFGATGAIFMKGTVNPYNPKVLRASAGSLFRLPMIHGLDEGQARAELGQRKLNVYAAMPKGWNGFGRCESDAAFRARGRRRRVWRQREAPLCCFGSEDSDLGSGESECSHGGHV